MSDNVRWNINKEKWILKSIDFQFLSIKYIHTKFFQNLDVIIIRDFYQVQPNCHVGVFKTNAKVKQHW
jgi:hypothetical protein